MQKGLHLLAIALVTFGFMSACTRIKGLIGGGGTRFVIRIETEKRNVEELAELATRIIGARLDAAGLDGDATRIANPPDQISVRVYGEQDLELVKRFLFTTHKLELKKVVSAPNPSPVTMYTSLEAAQAAAKPGQEVLPWKEAYETSRSPQFVIVETEPVVTGEHVRTANAMRLGTSNDYNISFTLNKDGAERLGDWTGRNIGNYMAVVVDGSVVSAAYIKSQIFDSAEISGSFTKAAAEELASNLNSGYLPAKLIVLEEQRFGD